MSEKMLGQELSMERAYPSLDQLRKAGVKVVGNVLPQQGGQELHSYTVL